MSQLEEAIGPPVVERLRESGPVYARITGSLQRMNSLSKNNRYYPESVVRRAVDAGNQRLAMPGRPIQMLVSHGAMDADRPMEVIGKVTRFFTEGDMVRYEGEIPNTSAGRDMANLLSGGFHNAVSLRSEGGARVGKGMIDGKQVSVVEDMKYDGVDFTLRPGVVGAGVDTVQLFESIDPARIEDADGPAVAALTERQEAAARGSASWYAMVQEAADAGLVPIGGLETWQKEWLPILERRFQEPGHYTTADRAKIDKGNFAGPHKSFPIETAKDVTDAARLAGRSENPSMVKAKIKAIATKRGFPVPESYKDKDADGDNDETGSAEDEKAEYRKPKENVAVTEETEDDATVEGDAPVEEAARDESKQQAQFKKMPAVAKKDIDEERSKPAAERGPEGNAEDEDDVEDEHKDGLAPKFTKKDGKGGKQASKGLPESLGGSLDALINERIQEALRTHGLATTHSPEEPSPQVKHIATLAESLTLAMNPDKLTENDPFNPEIRGKLAKAHDTIAGILGTKCQLGDDYLGTGQGGIMSRDMEGDMRKGGLKGFDNHKGASNVQQPGYSTHESMIPIRDVERLIETLQRRGFESARAEILPAQELREYTPKPDPTVAALLETVRLQNEQHGKMLEEFAAQRVETERIAKETAERTTWRQPARATSVAENADAAPGEENGMADIIAKLSDQTVPSQRRRWMAANLLQAALANEQDLPEAAGDA